MGVQYDDALKLVGEYGRFQRVFLYLGSLFCVFGCAVNLGIVFLSASPDHWCRVPALEKLNLTLEEKKALIQPAGDDPLAGHCQMRDLPYDNLTEESARMLLSSNGTWPVIGCRDGWTYDSSQYQSSIVTEWDLVCQRRPLAAMAQSTFMAGYMVGMLVFGILADSVGRRRIQFMTISLSVSTALISTWSVNFYMYTAMRFFMGFATMPIVTLYYIVMMEIVGPDYRIWVGMLTSYTWAAGYFVVAGLAFFIREWRHLQLAVSVPLLLYFVVLYFHPESPRWLYSKGQVKEADELMKKIAKTNGEKVPEILHIRVTDSPKTYIWSLCGFPRLRVRTIIVLCAWFVNALVYYGLSLNTSSLGGNDYINFMISGFIEIPAYIFCHLTLDKLGRKSTVSGTMLLGGCAMLLTLAVPMEEKYTWARITLTTTGKFGISAAFTIMYIYTTELFPTSIRSSILGTSSFAARIGAIVAPQMALLGDFGMYIPFVVFGALAFLSGASVLTLPETAKCKLPETLQDAEDFHVNLQVDAEKGSYSAIKQKITMF